MANLLSPGINISEIDLTTIVPSVSTSIGAFAGLFRWGPVGERVLVESEDQLVAKYGKPTSFNAETWFTAANFLGYTNALYVVRAANTTGITPSQTFTVTANSINSNNIYVVSTGNTANIVSGMYVSQSTNTSVTSLGVSVVSVINSSAVQLSQNTTGNTATTLYFANPLTTSPQLEPI